MAITPTDFSYAQELTGDDYTLTEAGEILINEDCVEPWFFDRVKNGGGDIRICTAADGVNELPIDVQLCDTVANGLLVFSRLFPYNSANRKITLFAGNAALSAYADNDTFGRNNVYQDCLYASHDGLTDITGNNAPTQSGTTLTTGPFGNSNGARLYDNSGNDSLYVAGLSISIPYTLVVLAKVGTTAGTRIISLADADTTDQQVYVYSNFGANVAAAIGSIGSAEASVSGSASDRTVDVWRSYAGRVSSATDRSVFLNGTQESATNTSASTPTGLDRLAMGVSADSTPFGNQPITTAEPRVYPFALTSTHIDMLDAVRSNPGAFWTQSAAYDPSATGGTEQPVVLIDAVQSESATTISISQSAALTSINATQQETAQALAIALDQVAGGISATQLERAGVLSLAQQQAVATVVASQIEQASTIDISSAQAVTLISAVQAESAQPMTIGQSDGQLITLIAASQNDNAQTLLISQIQLVGMAGAVQEESAQTFNIEQLQSINLIQATQLEVAQIMNIIQTGDNTGLDNLVLVPVTEIYTLVENKVTFTLEEK